MKNFIYLLILLNLWSCQSSQDTHLEPTHNFTVKRLLILNDKNEILMGKEASNWYTPSLIYNQRQYVKESLDSLSNTYGVTISTPQLRGYFSYKYEYHPYSTLRAYYVAKYHGGELKTPKGMEDATWMPIQEAIQATPVKSMKEIMTHLFQFPNTLWGGSFIVFRIGEDHQARMVEEFYPLSHSKVD